jgi:methionyl-tRNA synthetase
VWLHEYLDEFKNQQDALRYVLTTNAPETKDNDFTWKDFQARNNNELVAILGNFVNRTFILIHKYYDGIVPATENDHLEDGKITTANLITGSNDLNKIGKLIEGYKFREAIQTLINIAREGNRFLTEREPWKQSPAIAKSSLNACIQICANLALGMAPFLPEASDKLYKMLNIEPLKWNEGGEKIIIKSGHQLNKPELLFQKIENEAIEYQVQKLEKKKMEQEKNKKENPTPTTEKEKVSSISFDDFTKLDIRTATILEAEKVPDTAKLLKLKVDTGIDQRTIVSGIAEFYDPEKIIGKQICVLTNLAPRKIKGIESQGMVLMAENKDGKLYFVRPEETIGNGSKIS